MRKLQWARTWFVMMVLPLVIIGVVDKSESSNLETIVMQNQMTTISGNDDPDSLQGVRTKWLSRTKDARNSIIPDLVGLAVTDWVRHMEDLGVNAADLNLEPRRSLLQSPVHEVGELTEKQIEDGEYTPEQRNQLIVDFLRQVKEAQEQGKIRGNIKFLVHQRLYPRKDPTRENQYIEDMSSFINLAKINEVDQFILGLRFGENGISDMGYLLQFALKVTQQINSKTDNWLKERGCFILGGGQYGALFKGVQNTVYSKDFFQNISKYTASFAFGYKHFLDKDLAAYGYDINDPDDWKQYLLSVCGLAEIRDLIDANKEQYPKHANLVFVGDSGDAIKQINQVEYQALTELFQSFSADGFSGNIGMNAYTGPRNEAVDDGKALMSVVSGRVIVHPNTLAKWRSWPQSPSN